MFESRIKTDLLFGQSRGGRNLKMLVSSYEDFGS